MSGYEMTNIEVYRKKWHMNIGIIIFGAIFIYLAVTVLAYVTASHVSVYEVREGSILKDTAYTGLVLRQETVVNAEQDGYVNYFVAEGSKVGKKTNVYSLSPDKISLDSRETAGEDPSTEPDSPSQSLPDEAMTDIQQKAQSFSESYQDSAFSDVYKLKDAIKNIISTNSAQNRQTQLDAMLSQGKEGLSAHTATDDGIIVYAVDGYEGITKDQVTEQTLSRTEYESLKFTDNYQVKTGEPVYKLVTSEEWSLVIKIDDKFAKEMADVKSVRVRFAKDNQTTTAAFAIYNTLEANLAFLTFDHSMVRYADERFLDIELILEDQSGLKIPKSAVTKKDFYLVPESYLDKGGNGNETGVLTQAKDGKNKFQAVNVYYREKDTSMVYLDLNTLAKDTVLLKRDSKETYTVSKKESLSGVYNINKGYAVFCPIEELCESDEYYIVESGNDYGLSNYDHIALDSSSVRGNHIVF